MPDPVVQEPRPLRRIDSLLAWIKSHEGLLLLAAVAFQVVFLLAMIALRLTPLLTGETILVRVVPVDPRELFRGDYVVLSYEFSRLPPNVAGQLGSSPQREQDWRGQTVYVTLVPEPDGKHWRAGQFSTYPPPGGKFLRGHVTGFGRIEFGIEAYYLQEGRGAQYEQANRERRLAAEIAVTPDGQAALRGLRIE